MGRANHLAREQKKKESEDMSGIQRPMRTRGQTYGFEKTIISWIIYTTTFLENKIVRYMNPKLDRVVLEGTIKSPGILCHCCSKVLTVKEFQMHAGYYNGPRPYANIFVEPGIPLLECMVKSWVETQKTSTHLMPDDARVKFTNEGDFLCCSKCGFMYNLHCKGKKDASEVSWLCPYCICKSCGKACADEDSLITCKQCEKYYHWRCYANKNAESIDLNYNWTAFCDHNCEKVYKELRKTLGAKTELNNGFSWTLLGPINQEFDAFLDDEYEIAVYHSKLAIAWNVMEECFHSISGGHARISRIDHIIFNYQANFKGAYIAVLEKDDEIFSMACLRIHGTKLAEIPFIATCEKYRNKGMCKQLMFGIEWALRHLQIENLVVSFSKEMASHWIRHHRFKKIEKSLEEDIRHMKTLLFFNNTTKIQKTLTANPVKSKIVFDIDLNLAAEDEGQQIG